MGLLKCICRNLCYNGAVLRVCQITESVQGPVGSRKIDLMGKQSGFVNCT